MKNRKWLILSLVISVLFLSGVLFWKGNIASGTTNREEFCQQVRNSLAEISLPTSGDPSAISSATENLAEFVYYRSGVQLSQNNKELLKELEQKSWAQSKQITSAQLSQILSVVALERLANASDEEINRAVESLRGFNASDLPEGFRRGRDSVKLRANGEGTMSIEEFTDRLNSIRNSHFDDNLLATAVANRVSLEVERRIKILSGALPETFGNASESITPMQAVLIAYSIVTDDPLAYNRAGLQQRMQNLQQGISAVTGQNYSNPQGQRAYGANGYIYSSPADLILDDVTVAKILNLIKEESGIQ